MSFPRCVALAGSGQEGATPLPLRQRHGGAREEDQGWLVSAIIESLFTNQVAKADQSILNFQPDVKSVRSFVQLKVKGLAGRLSSSLFLLLDITVVVTVSLLLVAQCSPQDKTRQTDMMRLRKVGIPSLIRVTSRRPLLAGQPIAALRHHSGQTTARGPYEAAEYNPWKNNN